ncbi:hypothetical protein [Micromonospora sp. NBC_01813]|uniref:hypothetical protein n=1 Tax=Micromonospora sp. NBC_01813 TaxID=2975988 RepID=UPI002DD9E6D6|nr:hypothetical protein [Micromonospora sp. NBC_01813]WSA07091.1 hypothetical protein OG958_22885 [Micromonospora sp. NBC_01813]
MGATPVGGFPEPIGLLTCGFAAATGAVGVGAPGFGRRVGRLFRALFLIFLRVRRAAFRTRLAVASAQRRCASGSTLM